MSYLETCLLENLSQRVEVPEGEIGAKDADRFGTGVTGGDLDEGAVGGLVGGSIPDLDADCAFGSTTLAISFRAAVGSGKNIKAAWQNTMSNEADGLELYSCMTMTNFHYVLFKSDEVLNRGRRAMANIIGSLATP